MSCKDFQELIALYIESDLPQHEIAEVENHLKSCAACKEFAEHIKESTSALKRLNDDPGDEKAYQQIRQKVLSRIEEKPSQRFAWFGMFRWSSALIAALMAAVAIAGVFTISRLIPKPPRQAQKQIEKQPPKQSEKLGNKTDTSNTKTLHVESQKKEGAIYGQVLDDQGHPVPGVSITAQSNQIASRSTVTDAKGNYRFENLPAGQYSVGFSLEGFYQVRHLGIELKGESDTKLIAKLKPSLAEQIQVTGESPVVDTEGISVGSLLHEESTETVPSSPPPAPADEFEGGVLGGAIAGQPIEMEPGYLEDGRAEFDAELNRRMLESDPNINVQRRIAGTLKSGGELVVISTGDKLKGKQAAENLPTTQGTLRAENSEGEVIGEFPLKHTEVTAEISGYIARTLVEQEYTNPYKEVIEAVYVFPLSAMGAVNDFVMEIGDRKIVGVVRPREEAERIYREARQRGYTASLLTQERPNIFTQNVANIEPGGKVKIKITYFERLNIDHGNYEYVFPMVVGPRYIPGNPESVPSGQETGGGWSAPTDQVSDADKITPPVLEPGERSGHDIGLTIHLDAGIPIQQVNSIAHQVKIDQDGPSRRTIKLQESNSIPNRDFVLRWSVAGSKTQFGTLAHREKDAGFFTLMIQPPINPADDQVMPREITFIMDISGSMSGIPLEMSKNIVLRTLDRLRPEDIFNIVVFASGDGQLWERPQPWTPENVATAKQYLTSLQGSGGTEMLSGLRRALDSFHDQKYLQMYAFLTDGYVGNEEQILKVVKEEKGEARFFAFGIGSSVNRFLIDGIGEYGNGASQVVIPRDQDHAQKATDQFFDCIDSPVLVDIEIDWNDLPIRNIYPKKIKDLFAGQTIDLIGQYTQPADGDITVHGRIGSRAVQYKVRLELPKNENENAALAPLWARYKIQDLSGELLTSAAERKQTLTKQITDLAVRYKLVSPFTSFVAVDESRIVGDGKPLKVLQPIELPESINYAGIFGEGFVGQAFEISSWGIVLQKTTSGKIVVVKVNESGIAWRSGVRQGAVLTSMNRILVHDLTHLEGLLLQASEQNVRIGFEKVGEILLPLP
jgi:Ca-activated chloride channel family protein